MIPNIFEHAHSHTHETNRYDGNIYSVVHPIACKRQKLLQMEWWEEEKEEVECDTAISSEVQKFLSFAEEKNIMHE